MPLSPLQPILGCISLGVTQLYILVDQAQINGTLMVLKAHLAYHLGYSERILPGTGAR